LADTTVPPVGGGDADELVAQRRLIPIQQAAELLQISWRTLRRAEQRGDLTVISIGRRRFVTPKELDRYVAQLEHRARAI